jgi:hypothetical protein
MIVLLLALPLTQVTYFQDRYKQLLAVADTSSKYAGGSSFEMRDTQLALSLFYFSRSPLFGNGFSYFTEELAGVEHQLFGAESYIFILLIDQGGIQIVLNIVFAIFLYLYFFRKFGKNKELSSLGISLFTTFIFVSIVTGNTGKWELAVPIIGVILYKLRIPRFETKLLTI